MNQTFTFADRLKSAMEQKHMKQVDLIHAAETAGVKVGKSHISQYVSGKTVPRAEILHFLSETLDVDADWLSGNGGNTVNLETSPKRTSSLSSANLGANVPNWSRPAVCTIFSCAITLSVKILNTENKRSLFIIISFIE